MEHVIPDYLGNALHRICEQTATPRSLTVAILLRYREWDQLVTLDCDPVNYTDADHYYGDVVVTDFLRKTENLPTSFDRTKVAEDNFWKSERGCYSTNERLSPYVNGLPPLVGTREERFPALLAGSVKRRLRFWALNPRMSLWAVSVQVPHLQTKGNLVPSPIRCLHVLRSLPTLYHFYSNGVAQHGLLPVRRRG